MPRVDRGPIESIARVIGGQADDPTRAPKLDTTRIDEERQLGLQARDQQQTLGNVLMSQAQGGGPSMAGLQLQGGLAVAQQQAARQAASARGVNRAFALQQALQSQGQLAAQAQQQAAQARVQEQLGAQTALSQALQTQRSQDIQSRQLSTQEQQMLMDAETARQRAQADIAMSNAKNAQGPALAGMAAVGGLFASDIRAKEEIAPLDTVDGSREALAPVEAFRFRYKPEFAAVIGADAEPRAGVMAQDLERSPALRSAVVQTPLGKALDRDRLLQADTALLAGLDKRLRKLEGGKAAR